MSKEEAKKWCPQICCRTLLAETEGLALNLSEKDYVCCYLSSDIGRAQFLLQQCRGTSQGCFTEASEGLSDVGVAVVWHKAFIAEFVSLGAGLDAFSSMLVVQSGAGFIPDIM